MMNNESLANARVNTFLTMVNIYVFKSKMSIYSIGLIYLLRISLAIFETN